MSDDAPQAEFEISRKAARRAQITLNVLVVLSAVAASVFFVYVLHNLRPFGKRDVPAVNVPTSAVGPAVGLLRTDKAATLFVELRDVDDAAGYRDTLSQSMARALGIARPGRLYRLLLRNAGKEAVEIRQPALAVRDKNGRDWVLRWLADVADAGTATAYGRMLLAQGVADGQLGPGESRQLLAFIEGEPPPAEQFHSAELTAQGGLRAKLEHQEVRVSAP
ncbi:MAG: hypothetical protein HS108_13500 [Planctomycetes bacterium]|jgi:hypothetical protein|nr:hypothetical protein [Planctomycetota bacterium]MCL4730171.1 hypothetical protein [Planctomycetota bacterium]